MTTYNKATLKTFFQTNDIPDGTDYANFIDSYVNIVETTLQTMAGPLSVTELNTALVSGVSQFNNAGSITFNADSNITFSAANTVTFNADNSMVFNSDSGVTFSAQGNVNINAGGSVIVSSQTSMTINSPSGSMQMNAASLTINSPAVTVSAATITTKVDITRTVAIISAAGTTQGAASLCSAAFCRLQGVNDGSTTGFALPANKIGTTQFIRNETAVSANLWPPTGGQINALGANIPFPLAANTPYTVVHFQASAYSVK